MKYFIVVAILITLISCNKLISVALGIKKPRIETHQEQINFLSKYKIDTNNTFDINTLYIDSLYNSNYCLDTFNSFSPIQYRVYDKTGEFIGGWELCFGNSKILKIFDSIPPVTSKTRLPINYSLSFNRDKKLIKDFNIDENLLKKYDYVIIVFWSKYLGLLSRRLLLNIQNYVDENNKKRFLVLKINISTFESQY